MQFLILVIYMFLIFFNAAFISWVIYVLWHLTSCFLEKKIHEI